MLKLRLNYEQVEALYALFTDMLNHGDKQAFDSMEARLFFLLMYGIYEKLHKLVKPAGATVVKAQLLTLDEKDSLAFYLFFTEARVPAHHAHAGLLVQTIVNQINEQYV